MTNFKIEKITEHRTGLLKLKLLKTGIYRKKNLYDNFKIEDVEYRLKKALHIIYKYHINNKRILFVGTPLSTHQKLKELTRDTKHVLIPESVWVNGVITNQSACFKYLSENQSNVTKKILKLLFQLKKKNDLIVILNQSSNRKTLDESYNARIPVISLSSDLNILNIKPTYKVPGNFSFTKKKIRDNLFYSILSATFKKARKDKGSLTRKKALIKR